MATIQFKRPLQTTQSTFSGTVNIGFIVAQPDGFYIPLSFDNFTNAVPAMSITGIDLNTASNASGTNTITGSVGKFDNVRVGDILTAVSAGTLTAKTTVSVAASTFEGLNYVVYNDSSITVQAGDAVSGDGIPTNTVIDRIDSSTRRMFLTNPATENGSTILTVTPAVRVVEVRTSTASANPNQIKIDTTVAANGTNATLTIQNGAREAVFGVLRLVPVDDSTGSRAAFNLGFSAMSGSNVRGYADGLNPINYSSLGFTGAGSFSFNGDAFLTAARVPRPAS